MSISFTISPSADSNQNLIDPIPILLLPGNPKSYLGPFNEFDNLNRLRLGYRPDIHTFTNYFIVPYHRILQLLENNVWTKGSQRLFLLVRHFNEVTEEWETLLTTRSSVCDIFRLDFNPPTESLALLEFPNVTGITPKFKKLLKYDTVLRFRHPATSFNINNYHLFDLPDDEYLLRSDSIYVNGKTIVLYRNTNTTNLFSSVNVWNPPGTSNISFPRAFTYLASSSLVLPHNRYKHIIKSLTYPIEDSQQIMPVFYIHTDTRISAGTDYPLLDYIDVSLSGRIFVGSYSSSVQEHLVWDFGDKETVEERTELLFRDEGHSEYLITSFTPTNPEYPKDPIHAHTIDFTPKGTRLSFTTGENYIQPRFVYSHLHGINTYSGVFFSATLYTTLVGPTQSSINSYSSALYHNEFTVATRAINSNTPIYGGSKTRRNLFLKPNLQAPLYFQNRKVSSLNFEVLDTTFPEVIDTREYEGYVWTVTNTEPLPYTTGKIIANYLNNPFSHITALGYQNFSYNSRLGLWYYGLCTNLERMFKGHLTHTITYDKTSASASLLAVLTTEPLIKSITWGDTTPQELYEQNSSPLPKDINHIDYDHHPRYLSEARYVNFGEPGINRKITSPAFYATTIREITETNTFNETIYHCKFRRNLDLSIGFSFLVPQTLYFDFYTTIRLTPEQS